MEFYTSENSKIINTMKQYYTIIDSGKEPTEDERFFVVYFFMSLANSIIQECGESQAVKLANVILAMAT